MRLPEELARVQKQTGAGRKKEPQRAQISIALAMAFGLVGCASSPESKGSASESSGDDAALTAKVKSAIATDVGARAASSINVDTYKGVVQLSGFVDSKDMANRALDAAKKVSGVKTLKNELRVKSS